MPVSVRKSGKLWRVVESSTGAITKSSNGKAKDGGGHSSKAKASAQARAINAGLKKAGKI